LATSKAIWDKWIDAGQRKQFDAEIETLINAIEVLQKQGNKGVAQIFRFLDKNGSRDWSQVDIAVTDMLAEIRDNLGAIDKPLTGIVRGSVGASLEQLNSVGAMIGKPLAKYDVYGSFIKAEQRHILRLSDKVTRESIEGIYQALHDGWKSPGSDILLSVKKTLGIDKDVLGAYKTAVEKFKDLPPIDQFRKINEALDKQQTLAWKAQRIVRSEAGILNADIYNEWEQSLEGVEFTEFAPEPNACDECAALAGLYPAGTAPIPVVDTHPNCNCSTRPHFEGEENKGIDKRNSFDHKPPRGKVIFSAN
jgi:hypothetical protein